MLTIVPCRQCMAPVIMGVLPEGISIYVNAKWQRLGQYVFLRDDCVTPDPYGRIPARHYYRHRCHA